MRGLLAFVGFASVTDWRRGRPRWAHRLYLWASGEPDFTDITLRDA